MLIKTMFDEHFKIDMRLCWWGSLDQNVKRKEQIKMSHTAVWLIYICETKIVLNNLEKIPIWNNYLPNLCKQ